MPHANLIISYLFFAVLAGVVGTAGLTGFLMFLTRSGVARAPMVVALGSLFTHSRHRAMEVGLLIHILSGVFFGMFYTWVLMAIGIPGVGSCLLFGMLIGLVQGVFVAIALVAAVADHHPLDEFKNAGFGVALAHAVAHVIYGGIVGLIIGLSPLVTS